MNDKAKKPKSAADVPEEDSGGSQPVPEQAADAAEGPASTGPSEDPFRVRTLHAENDESGGH